MRANDFIAAIDDSSGVGDNTKLVAHLSPDNADAHRVGVVDSMSVYCIEYADAHIYFIYDKELMSYAVVSKEKIDGSCVLKQLERAGSVTGTGTALIVWLVRKACLKMVIPKFDKWTHKGMTWLTNSIAAGGRGLRYTDNTGVTPDCAAVWDEWEDNRQNQTPGRTSIFIETRLVNDSRLFEDRIGWLMPMYVFRGDPEIE